MREYRQYEAFYMEQNKLDGDVVGPETLNITYEDIGAKHVQATDEFREIEELFKSRYQGIARVILSTVRKAGGKMDQYQRLIYPNGQLGSSLYELVRYTIIPARSRKGMPVDFTQFARLLREQNAPGYILARIGEYLEPTGNGHVWLKYPTS